MKIAHTSDLHLGKSMNFYSLEQDQIHFLDKFVEQLKLLDVDCLIIAGDVYDRSLPPSWAVSLLNKFLSTVVLELKIPTYVISGNHDSAQRLSFANEILSSNGLHIIGTPTLPATTIEQDNTVFHLIPYVDVYSLREILGETASTYKNVNQAFGDYISHSVLDPTKLNIAIAHGTFVNSSTGEGEIGHSDFINSTYLKEFDYVALGHIHTPIDTGYEHILYSGAPLKYSIDSKCESGFLLVEVEKNKPVVTTHIDIKPLHNVVTLTDSFDNLRNKEIGYFCDDYVKIQLTDTDKKVNAMSILSTTYRKILQLIYINDDYIEKLSSQQAHIEQKTEYELYTEFYKQMTNNELSQQQLEKVQEIFNTLKRGDDN